MLAFYQRWILKKQDLFTEIKTVARFFNWNPHEINELYCDDLDHLGLTFWYNDCLEQDKEMRKNGK